MENIEEKAIRLSKMSVKEIENFLRQEAGMGDEYCIMYSFDVTQEIADANINMQMTVGAKCYSANISAFSLPINTPIKTDKCEIR